MGYYKASPQQAPVFSINNDEDLTERIENKIRSTDWAALHDENCKTDACARKGAVCGSNTLEQMKTALAEMRSNCNVSTLLPEKTRLRVLKKAVLRVMGTPLRFQQAFNTHCYRAYGMTYEEVRSLSKQIADLQATLSEQERRIKELEGIQQKQDRGL